jgi:hypothetical protein
MTRGILALNNEGNEAGRDKKDGHDNGPYEKELLRAATSMESVSAVSRAKSAAQAGIGLLEENAKNNKYYKSDLDIREELDQGCHVLKVYPKRWKSKVRSYPQSLVVTAVFKVQCRHTFVIQ